MADGIINIDTEFAKELGFTSDKFGFGSYLWKKDNTIIISAIWSTVKGAFRNLMQNIEQKGYGFKIPTPFPRMLEIGEKQGWKLITEYDDLFGGEIHVLVKEAKNG